MKTLSFTLVALALAACSADSPSRTDATRSPSPSVSTSPSPGRTATGQPPPTVEPTHGGEYWAAYIAAGDPTSQAFKDRLQLLKSKGLPHQPGDVGCDQGAQEALGISDEEQIVGVYFTEELRARDWAELAPVDVLAVAKVQTYCLD